MITLEGFSYRFIPEEVPNPGEIVFTANDFYRRPDVASVPVLQLTYDDDDSFLGTMAMPRPSCSLGQALSRLDVGDR